MSADLMNEMYPKSTKSRRPSLRRSSQRDDQVKRVHAIFGLVGLIIGAAVALYAYNETSSIALAIFVVVMVQSYIGRGLGDVATDPEKGKRFVYFTLQPLLAGGVLWLTYQWWDNMWLSAFLGFLVGGLVWGLLAALLFPKIAEEEAHDNQERWTRGGL